MTLLQYQELRKICQLEDIPENSVYNLENLYQISNEQANAMISIVKNSAKNKKELINVLITGFYAINKAIDSLSEDKKVEAKETCNKIYKAMDITKPNPINGKKQYVCEPHQYKTVLDIVKILIENKKLPTVEETISLLYCNNGLAIENAKKMIILGRRRLIKKLLEIDDERTQVSLKKVIDVSPTIAEQIIENYEYLDIITIEKIESSINEINNCLKELYDDKENEYNRFKEQLIDLFKEIIRVIVKDIKSNNNGYYEEFLELMTILIKNMYINNMNISGVNNEDNINSIKRLASQYVNHNPKDISLINSKINEYLSTGGNYSALLLYIMSALKNSTNEFQIDKIFDLTNHYVMLNNIKNKNLPLHTGIEKINQADNKIQANAIVRIIKVLTSKKIQPRHEGAIPGNPFYRILNSILDAKDYSQEEINEILELFNLIMQKQGFNNSNPLATVQTRYNPKKIFIRVWADYTYWDLALLLENLCNIKKDRNRIFKLKKINEMLKSQYPSTEDSSFYNFERAVKGIISSTTESQVLRIKAAYIKHKVFNRYDALGENDFVQFINRVLESGDDLPKISDVIDLFNLDYKNEIFLVKDSRSTSEKVESRDYIKIASGNVGLSQAQIHLGTEDYNNLIDSNINEGYGETILTKDAELSTKGYVLCLSRRL